MYDACTVAVMQEGFACCRTCGDYESAEATEVERGERAKEVVAEIVDSVVRSLFLISS